tara:strand:- start:9474 stop:11174 length:1701 start_codon:yes stop_codon:yes gene_type:complete
MSDWSKPALTSTYTAFISELKYRDEVVGSLYSTDLSPAPSNLPADASTNWGKRSIRWNATNKYFERRNAANNGWERLETGADAASSVHNFLNIGATNVTATGTVSGDDLTATDQLEAARVNVTGDTTPVNGVYLPSANELSFVTDSNRRITIESDGKVGIGTNTANKELEIQGNVRIQNDTGDTALEIGLVQSGATAGREASIALAGDSTYTAGAFTLKRNKTGSPDSRNASTQITHRGTGDFIFEATEAADILFKTTDTTRFVIDSGGNLGIGNVTAPGANIHIKRTDAAGQFIKFENSEGSAYIRGDADKLYIDADEVLIRNEAGTDLISATESLFTCKKNAQFDGNLTVTGQINATIQGSSASANTLTTARKIANVDFDGSADISLNNNQITNGAGYTTFTANQALNTNSNVTFSQGVFNGSVYVNDDDNESNIYMGDQDDGQRRIKNDSNKIGFLTQAGGDGAYCDDSGNWTAVGNLTAYSDERLKENIQTIPSALETVKKLRGVSFTKKDSGVKGIGVIAQEIEKVLPEVVLDGEFKSVSYGNIIGLLIEAIKELSEKAEK